MGNLFSVASVFQYSRGGKKSILYTILYKYCILPFFTIIIHFKWKKIEVDAHAFSKLVRGRDDPIAWYVLNAHCSVWDGGEENCTDMAVNCL